MIPFVYYEQSAEMILETIGVKPKTAIVLGSGLGVLADRLMDCAQAKTAEIPYDRIPHFPVSTVASHAGKLLIKEVNEKPIVLLSGRFHFYEGYSPEAVAYYVRVLKLMGIENLILTNAAGGISEHFAVGDLVLITDHIKFGMQSPCIGANDARFGDRFFDMSDPYCQELREIAHACANEMGNPLQEGVYAFMAGPQFETPAEIHALKILGADLVGMSTVFEAIEAAHCGLNVLGISCVTNLAAGISTQKLDDAHVVKAAAASADRASELITGILQRL